MGKISAEAISSLKIRVDATTTKPNGVAGLVYTAVDRDGDIIFEHASGQRGLGSDQPMTPDTVFWIASCTKMIVGIAAMQLVEQGKLALDDVEQVERLAPELRDVKVLERSADGKLSLVEKKRAITLRMLLTHTAGFGYSFLNKSPQEWLPGLSEFSGKRADVLDQPLVHQPGEKWQYGVNIDWVGELVARVSGLKLNDYLRKNVLEPIGVKDITLFPTKDMKDRLALMHQRSPDGSLKLRDGGHIMNAPLDANLPEENTVFHSGGGGGFGVPSEYCKIIATLLNNGTDPKTGAQILKPESVNGMLSNHIPQFPDFGRAELGDGMDPLLIINAPEIYPQPHDQAQGWGLTFFHHVHGTETGRAAGTVFWSGLPNCFWWADRERGLGGFVASQILPHGDMDVLTCWQEVEAGLYAALGRVSAL